MCGRLPKVHHDFILWLAKWTSVGIHVSVQPEEGSAVLFLRPIGIKDTAVCGSNGCLKHLWSTHKKIWIVRKCSINRKTSKLHIVFSGTIEIGDWVARRQDSAKLWPVGRGGSWLLLSQLHSKCTGRTSPWPFYGFWPWRASIHAAKPRSFRANHFVGLLREHAGARFAFTRSQSYLRRCIAAITHLSLSAQALCQCDELFCRVNLYGPLPC